MNAKTTYNERSWAIDLIGHLKILAANNHRSIKDAGGDVNPLVWAITFKLVEE